MKLLAIVATAASIAIAPAASHATLVEYTVTLNGQNEAPANNSPGFGSGTVTFDTVLRTMVIAITFSGLTGTVTAAHIHAATALPFAGTAGVATPTPTFPGFPAGVTSGSYNNTFDTTLASTYNATYVTANGGTAGAEAALLAAAAGGRAYFNIHTTTFPGGEIRGFLAPVPEPATGALLGVGGMWLLARRNRKK